MRTIMLLGCILLPALMTPADSTFGDDVAFLQKHTKTFVLKRGGAAIAVTPEYQGRVMTSSADGDQGLGFGWINNEAIESGEIKPHINVFGGEDRFWIGPEGGQFSVFFKGGDPMDLEHWQTPAPIDSEEYTVAKKTATSAVFTHNFTLTNTSGTPLHIGVQRTVELLSGAQVKSTLGLGVPSGVKAVAYRTTNRLSNEGKAAWTKKSGAPSIWILGMYKPGAKTTIAIPYNTAGTGKPVNDNYFGKVPASRLKTGKTAVFFSGDGQYRSKIGVPPTRTKVFNGGSVMGSWDAVNGVLTIVHFSFKPGVTDYVNSSWVPKQPKPFGGDVGNSYNDGPPSPGAKPLGPFYEIESSSPALFLKPGTHHDHVHATFHFQGSKKALDGLCKKVLGVSIQEVENALGK